MAHFLPYHSGSNITASNDGLPPVSEAFLVIDPNRLQIPLSTAELIQRHQLTVARLMALRSNKYIILRVDQQEDINRLNDEIVRLQAQENTEQSAETLH